jgi:hypothetical protein
MLRAESRQQYVYVIVDEDRVEPDLLRFFAAVTIASGNASNPR